VNLRYSKEETQAMVAEHDRWFHQIAVGHGISTPGGHNSEGKLKRIQMPADLTGWSVLDIGANDGFFSFTAEERGAKRVLAVDDPHWSGQVEYYGKTKPHKDRFETVRELRGSAVVTETKSVYDFKEHEYGRFDLVLFLGVIYHLIHPTLGLERAVRLAKKMVIVEFGLHKDNVDGDVPMMIFTPDKYNGDATNWWYPNPQCVKDMMLTFGCSRVEQVSSINNHSRTVFHGFKD